MSPWIDIFYRLNPLIRREMRRMSRMGRTHILLLILPILLLMSLLDWPIAQFLNRSTSLPRLSVLNAFVNVAYYLATLVMPALAISAVSMERESGSMDMLRAAGLGAGRILTGKTNGLLCVFSLMLLTGLPVVSVVMLFGGVDFRGLLTIVLISLVAAFRAASFGFLAYGLVGNLFTATALAYIGALGWPWLIEQAMTVLPDLAQYKVFIEPSAALNLLVSPGAIPTIPLLGTQRPFWWATLAILLLQSLGCLILAGPLLILPAEKASALWRPRLKVFRRRRLKERDLAPNNCNIIFERDFRSGLYAGRWLIWWLLALLLTGVFSAVVRWSPFFMEGLRVAVGFPLFFIVAVQTSTAINRLRSKDILSPILLTGITPRALLEAKAFYAFIMVAPFLIAVWICDCLSLFPTVDMLLPIHTIKSRFLLVALQGGEGEQAGSLIAGTCAYLTHFVYLFVIIAFGLRFSTQFNASTAALLHTVGWSALVLVIANVVLNVGVWILLAIFSLGITQGGPLDLVVSLGPSVVFFLIWAYFVIMAGIKQYKIAVHNMDRSMRVDEFGAPPSLYSAPSSSEVLEVERW